MNFVYVSAVINRIRSHRPRANQAVGQRQPVDVARATEIEVERPDRRAQLQPLLHQAGGRRKRIVRGLRAEQQEVDRRRIDLVPPKQLLRRLDTQIRGTFVRCGDMPSRNPRLLVNQLHVPLRELGLQLVVCLHSFGQVNGDRTHGCILHNESPFWAFLFTDCLYCLVCCRFRSLRWRTSQHDTRTHRRGQLEVDMRPRPLGWKTSALTQPRRPLKSPRLSGDGMLFRPATGDHVCHRANDQWTSAWES